MEVFGSVCSDLLVLHNYCVILSECQKVTFFDGRGKKNLVKKCKKQRYNRKRTTLGASGTQCLRLQRGVAITMNSGLYNKPLGKVPTLGRDLVKGILLRRNFWPGGAN